MMTRECALRLIGGTALYIVCIGFAAAVLV